jgi:hypothetical protein
MNPTYTISYGLAQARIADLHDQARRQSLGRAARSGKARAGAQSGSSRVPGHLRLVRRHRVRNAVISG